MPGPMSSSTANATPGSARHGKRGRSSGAPVDHQQMLEEMRAKRGRMSSGSSQPQADGQDDDDDEELGNTESGKENVDPNEVLTEEEISKIDNPNLASFLRTWPLTRACFNIAHTSLKNWEDIMPDYVKQPFDERLPSFSRGNREYDDLAEDAGGIAHYAPMTKVIEVCMPMFTAGKLEDMTASYKILSKRVTLIEETVQSLKKAKEATVEDTVSRQHRRRQTGKDILADSMVLLRL
ncbi:hypothetical protein V8E36_000662 [Tilletia maclaganii]